MAEKLLFEGVMEVIFILLPLTLLLALVAVVAFIWAVKRGQYQDLSTPAIKVLVDDQSSCSDDNVDGPGRSKATVFKGSIGK